jgi:uncharacterized protein YgiM (DUF1202 family)
VSALTDRSRCRGHTGRGTDQEDTVADTSRFVVIARDGLRLRSGASQDASVIRTNPEGTVVNVLSREGTFALVDLEGDGKAEVVPVSETGG